MIQFSHIPSAAEFSGHLHVALGVFDGVHRGHQAVISQAIQAAKAQGGFSAVLTFEPHPIRILAPAKAPAKLLATLHHKADILEKLGVDVLIAIPFTHEFAAVSAQNFLHQLLDGKMVKSIAVGEDWKFGKDRQGDIHLLEKFCADYGVALHALAPVMHQDERISSTRIRQAIRDGALENAAAMLGRKYAIEGTVIKGQQLGRTLGFPTANISLNDEQLPPDGVWIVQANTLDQKFNGVANLGTRPTVHGTSRSFEVHLFDCDADLYGKTLEATFLHHIREEKTFSSIEELRNQIQQDAAQAKLYFSELG